MSTFEPAAEPCPTCQRPLLSDAVTISNYAVALDLDVATGVHRVDVVDELWVVEFWQQLLTEPDHPGRPVVRRLEPGESVHPTMSVRRPHKCQQEKRQ